MVRGISLTANYELAWEGGRSVQKSPLHFRNAAKLFSCRIHRKLLKTSREIILRGIPILPPSLTLKLVGLFA